MPPIDGQTDRRTRWFQNTPSNFVGRGYRYSDLNVNAVILQGKPPIATYWLQGQKRISQSTPAELARDVTQEECDRYPGPMVATMVNGIKT